MASTITPKNYRKKLESRVYSTTHKDFKGLWHGEKTILVGNPKGGSMIAYLHAMSPLELFARLRSKDVNDFLPVLDQIKADHASWEKSRGR